MCVDPLIKKKNQNHLCGGVCSFKLTNSRLIFFQDVE